jgi:hypothetical protein
MPTRPDHAEQKWRADLAQAWACVWLLYSIAFAFAAAGIWLLTRISH